MAKFYFTYFPFFLLSIADVDYEIVAYFNQIDNQNLTVCCCSSHVDK